MFTICQQFVSRLPAGHCTTGTNSASFCQRQSDNRFHSVSAVSLSSDFILAFYWQICSEISSASGTRLPPEHSPSESCRGSRSRPRASYTSAGSPAAPAGPRRRPRPRNPLRPSSRYVGIKTRLRFAAPRDLPRSSGCRESISTQRGPSSPSRGRSGEAKPPLSPTLLRRSGVNPRWLALTLFSRRPTSERIAGRGDPRAVTFGTRSEIDRDTSHAREPLIYIGRSYRHRGGGWGSARPISCRRPSERPPIPREDSSRAPPQVSEPRGGSATSARNSIAWRDDKQR